MNKFTVGVLAGAVLGLLTAPAKGEETRKKLSNTANSWKNKLDELFGKGNDELDELKATLEDTTAEVTEELRAKLIKLVDRSKKAFKDAHQESIA